VMWVNTTSRTKQSQIYCAALKEMIGLCCYRER